MTTKQARELRANEQGRFLDEITVDLLDGGTSQAFLQSLNEVLSNVNGGINRQMILRFKHGYHRGIQAFTRYIIQDERFETYNFRVFDLNEMGEEPMGEITAYDPKSKQTKVNIRIGKDYQFTQRHGLGEDKNANLNISFIEAYS